jgi:mono/diheme cytochrome c family protein
MEDHLVQTEVLRVKACLWVTMIALCGCVLSGCGAPPMNYVLSEDTKKKLDAGSQSKVATALEDYFGTPKAPKIAEPLKPVLKGDDDALAQGASSYRRLCMHCHGLSGDGNGPTARFVLPLPRDYRRGIFKFTSTDQTANPTRDDLLHTVKNGIAGTSMPSFALFGQQEIENVLDYVILLSIRGQTEGFVVSEIESGGAQINRETVDEQATVVARRWVASEARVVKPKVPRTEMIADSLDRGRKLFLSERAQCTKCHGKEGRGDGLLNDANADPKDTKDSWGHQARPANLTLGVYRGGGRPIDLFRRIHSGIKGTPMPAQSTNLKDDEIWDLVNFVKALPYMDQASKGKAANEHGAGG